MEVRGNSSAALFEMLGQMRRIWIKGGWSWDSRFSCVASSFNVELERDAMSVVSQFFSNEWTAKNIQNASSSIREIAENTGGIRADQRVFTADTSGRLIAFGLWWPWGDEITVSLRIGVGGHVRETDIARLKETFGALD